MKCLDFINLKYARDISIPDQETIILYIADQRYNIHCSLRLIGRSYLTVCVSGEVRYKELIETYGDMKQIALFYDDVKERLIKEKIERAATPNS